MFIYIYIYIYRIFRTPLTQSQVRHWTLNKQMLAGKWNNLMINMFIRSRCEKRCSAKDVFLRISQNSQENTCVRALMKLQLYQKETLADTFSYEYWETVKNSYFEKQLWTDIGQKTVFLLDHVNFDLLQFQTIYLWISPSIFLNFPSCRETGPVLNSRILFSASLKLRGVIYQSFMTVTFIYQLS